MSSLNIVPVCICMYISSSVDLVINLLMLFVGESA